MCLFPEFLIENAPLESIVNLFFHVQESNLLLDVLASRTKLVQISESEVPLFLLLDPLFRAGARMEPSAVQSGERIPCFLRHLKALDGRLPENSVCMP